MKSNNLAIRGVGKPAPPLFIELYNKSFEKSFENEIKIFRKVGRSGMLMDIKCSMVPSIAVNLRFDDQSEKHVVVSVNDLVYVEYNANGCRKAIEGKVIKVSACGEDPRSWYIIVDGSDDFESQKAKFSPMSILDIEILRKADTLNIVQTVIGDHAVPYIRIVHGRLQWSIDSFNWRPIVIDDRDIIEDQEGTVPVVPPPCPHPHHHHHRPDDDTVCGCNDGIEDANS